MRLLDAEVQKSIIAAGDGHRRTGEAAENGEETYRAAASIAAATTSTRASGADDGVVKDWADGEAAGIAGLGRCKRISPRR